MGGSLTNMECKEEPKHKCSNCMNYKQEEIRVSSPALKTLYSMGKHAYARQLSKTQGREKNSCGLLVHRDWGGHKLHVETLQHSAYQRKYSIQHKTLLSLC